MKNKIQDGMRLKLTAPYAVSSGGGALVGTIFGVALTDVTSGAEGIFETHGVYELAKASADVVAQGAALYWDNTAKLLTVVATANTLVGKATEAAAGGTATAKLLLR